MQIDWFWFGVGVLASYAPALLWLVWKWFTAPPLPDYMNPEKTTLTRHLIDTFMQEIDLLPKDFQVTIMLGLARSVNYEEFITHPRVQEWVKANASLVASVARPSGA